VEVEYGFGLDERKGGLGRAQAERLPTATIEELNRALRRIGMLAEPSPLAVDYDRSKKGQGATRAQVRATQRQDAIWAMIQKKLANADSVQEQMAARALRAHWEANFGNDRQQQLQQQRSGEAGLRMAGTVRSRVITTSQSTAQTTITTVPARGGKSSKPKRGRTARSRGAANAGGGAADRGRVALENGAEDAREIFKAMDGTGSDYDEDADNSETDADAWNAATADLAREYEEDERYKSFSVPLAILVEMNC
jgi:hypothetical protein